MGELHAISARGTLMGNRGNLCSATPGQLVRFSRGKRWISCLTQYKSQRLPLAASNHNTQLFFLDEATALAAGHRPCAKCRNRAYQSFLLAWQAAHSLSEPPGVDVLDAHLHQQRNQYPGHDRTFWMRLAQIPDGSLVRWQHQPTLVYCGWLQIWSFAGYTPVQRIKTTAAAAEVPVLTPRSIVQVLQQGYRPEIHPTVHAGSASSLGAPHNHSRNS